MPVLRQSHLIVAHCLMAVLAFARPAWPQSGSGPDHGPNATIVEFGERRQQSPRRVAIVGNVERPGVYESSARRLTADLLFKASGSRNAAGDYFTRFHSGMVPLNTATWDAENALLADGDVIVVATSPTRPQPPSADHIHIAVLGLGKDPAVIRLPKADATLPGLFSLLGQSSEVTASATVNGARSNDVLKNGDVIVVRSYLINRAALFGCDAILQLKSLDAPPDPAKSTTTTSPPVSLPLEPGLPSLALPSAAEGGQHPPAVAAFKKPESSVAETPAAASIPPARSGSSTVHAAFEEQPHRNSRPTTDIATPRQDPGTNPARPVAVEQHGQIRNLVVLIALGTLGIGIALLWVASERRLESVASPEPVDLEPLAIPSAAKAPPQFSENSSTADEPHGMELDDLGQLLRGELTVMDEPVVLPARVALHGKAVGQKRLVIHPPQALAGPHFGHAAAEKVSAARESTSAPAIPRSSSSVQPATESQGLLDRVLLAMQREGRR